MENLNLQMIAMIATFEAAHNVRVSFNGGTVNFTGATAEHVKAVRGEFLGVFRAEMPERKLMKVNGHGAWQLTNSFQRRCAFRIVLTEREEMDRLLGPTQAMLDA